MALRQRRCEIFSEIRDNPCLSVACLVCLRFRGLVADFGFGVGFHRGEVTAFAAHFAVGGFAGPGAGAIFAGFVSARRRL